MKKNIANIITGSRIVFRLPLLFIPMPSVFNKITGSALCLLPTTLTFIPTTIALR